MFNYVWIIQFRSFWKFVFFLDTNLTLFINQVSIKVNLLKKRVNSVFWSDLLVNICQNLSLKIKMIIIFREIQKWPLKTINEWEMSNQICAFFFDTSIYYCKFALLFTTLNSIFWWASFLICYSVVICLFNLVFLLFE